MEARQDSLRVICFYVSLSLHQCFKINIYFNINSVRRTSGRYLGNLKQSPSFWYRRIIDTKERTCTFFVHFFRILWPCIVNIRWRERNQQDATNSMFIIKLSISTCFGHHYAHHQENKTVSYCMRCSAWVCRLWLAVVLWSCVVSCVHCVHFLSQHVSGIIMPIIRRIRPCPTACGVLPGCVGCGWLWSCGAVSWAVCTFYLNMFRASLCPSSWE